MRFLLLTITLIAFMACAQKETENVEVKASLYGAEFASDAVVTAVSLAEELNEEEQTVTFEGTVAEVCQAEGCWLKVDLGEGKEPIMVKMKDHDFSVPKDIAGKTIQVGGKASVEIMSVDEQKHYLADAGASMEEIEKITEDKKTIVVVADGVKVFAP